MHKDELLKILQEAIIAEEKSIPIYMKHLESAVFWAGWDAQTMGKIKTGFRFLADASMRHKEIIYRLIKKINEDPRDAF